MRNFGQSIRGNFGENSFCYNIESYIDKVINEITVEIIKTKLYPQSTRGVNLGISMELQLVKDYLLYNVSNL